MGNKVEVHAWVKTGDGYRFVSVYAGNSLFKAMIAAFRAKHSGIGMVKIEWR